MRIIYKFIELNWQWSSGFSNRFPKLCREVDYNIFLSESIHKELQSLKISKPSILEVGGIDRPLLHKSAKYNYDGLDVNYSPKCENVYDHFFIQSVEDSIKNTYDIVFSTTVLEHVPNNTMAATSMYRALNEGGATIHYIPSKYHPYSLILRAVGPKGQRWLIKHFRQESAHEVSGYPAFFNNCSALKMKSLFEKAGFKDVSVKCFYHANVYFAFFFPLFVLVSLWEYLCSIIKYKSACSGFVITARK